MKKLYLSSALLFCTLLAYSQDSLKVTARRFTTELNVNLFQGELSLNNALNQIKIRYFLTEGAALRIAFNFNSKKSDTDNSTVYGPNPNISSTEKKTNGFGLNFGVEKHFSGTNRLSPYVGAELAVATKSSSQTTKNGSFESKVDGAWLTTSYSGPNGPIFGYEERAYFQYGVNIITGFDFYVAKNFYLGYEIAFAFVKTKYKDVEITTKPVSTSSTPDFKQDDSTVGPNLLNGIRVGFVF